MVLTFSGLWVTHLAGMEVDVIMIVPLVPFHSASSLSLDVGYLYFVGSSILLSMVVLIASCDLSALTGDEHTIFTLPS